MLEGASLEEEPDLQAIWGNLLANAANQGQTNPSLPSFPVILKELTTREVRFLEELLIHAENQRSRPRVSKRFIDIGLHKNDLLNIFDAADLMRSPRSQRPGRSPTREELDIMVGDEVSFGLCMDIVVRNRLIQESYGSYVSDHEDPAVQIGGTFSLTDLGVAFVKACRPPTKS